MTADCCSVFRMMFWSLIVSAALGSAGLFLYRNTIDLMNATVVTTVDTMTAPLSEVFFPSLVVCNINQVKTVRLVSQDFIFLSPAGSQFFFC